ncbi:MAG: glycosyltransferase family 4 protein [Chloroflexi bacterium]|nr:glycosyltransferase family 4 protein [Chloroflexota bacterium]MBV9132043.1 glycosyltransferase family 4 protein [Chloroflexota bacterium]MBV9896170.1 glycosyltransferase family 4 protein [Chloroflexota bacterium]
MRIAYVCHYFVPEPAAPAARVHEFARYWVQAGHQVDVVTTFPNHPVGHIPPEYRGRWWSTEWLDGIRVLRCWLYAVPNRGVGRRGLDHLSFMATSLVFGLPRLRNVDVVIASSPTLFSALSAWLMARIKRVPFVLEVRDLWPEAIVDLGLMRRGSPTVRVLEGLARFLYRQASRVVVVTEAFAQRLNAQGVPGSKLAVIPNGADTRYFAPRQANRAALGLDGRFVVAYVGSHGHSHGLHAVLDAAAAQPEVTFLLVGDGAEREGLLEERQRRALRNVIMRPSIPKAEVPGVYAAADACLVPLRDVPIFETFVPSKLFEVLAAGRPVIGAVRGEARAILQRSGGAVLVEPERGDQLAEAIERLRQDAGLRDQLGRAGREFAQREYDRDTLAARYLDLLHEVVGA